MKPPRDCLSWALEAVLQSDSADPHRYGDVVGDQNLLEVIRRKLETVNKLTGQEIMVTAGANQVSFRQRRAGAPLQLGLLHHPLSRLS
mmetsp:Transcript_31296/g.120794  ORF Transcript_31296/g.120794 Transcript_31296/m.120794 type:complete len:88 (+) Transcript_31296:569-832(+)